MISQHSSHREETNFPSQDIKGKLFHPPTSHSIFFVSHWSNYEDEKTSLLLQSIDVFSIKNTCNQALKAYSQSIKQNKQKKCLWCFMNERNSILFYYLGWFFLLFSLFLIGSRYEFRNSKWNYSTSEIDISVFSMNLGEVKLNNRWRQP